MSGSGRSFVVAMRGESGLSFGPDGLLSVQVGLEQGRTLEVSFRSRNVAPTGKGLFIARDLWVDARGQADTLEDALQGFANISRGLLSIVSLAGNGPIDDVHAELGYESTPGLSRRSFFQQFLPEPSGRPVPTRLAPIEGARCLINAVESSAEKERLVRAIAHYYHALQAWQVGNEVFAVSHLFIAVEALTKSVLRNLLVREGITMEDLLKRWQIEQKQLDPEVRRRLLFQGDDAVYKSAKSASDAYEHSFQTPEAVRTTALQARDPTARYVRDAILRLVALPPDVYSRLTSSPFDKPFALHSTSYVKGVIIGEGPRLAAEGQVYPILNWRHRSGTSAEGKYQSNDNLTVRLGSGLRFEPTRVEFWGGPPEGAGALGQPEIRTGRPDGDEDPAFRAAKPRCLGWLGRWFHRGR
jgi:hypothetical protein